MSSACSVLRQPLFDSPARIGQVTAEVAAPLQTPAGAMWWACFAAAVSALILGTAAIAYQVATGIGTWGLNHTVGWAFDITNFVFWIGIGHAGTAISAILFLLRQRRRTSISRAAEAMTIFAVMCAGLFPLIHMGRPWFGYWVFPYPNLRGPLWVNFRSPLLWDVFAISTYFTISAVFWYLGLVPDLAALRDRFARIENPSPGIRLRYRLYAVLSLGWNGSVRVWNSYESLYLLLAGLATPLVISVHSIVSFDFATSILPGWHTTIFPPYFVAGALFSGFGMVLTLMLIARKVMNFEHYITRRHIEAMCKVVLATGGMVALAYGTELFCAWQSGNLYEKFAFANRAFGPFGWAYRLMVFCNVLAPQLLWSRRIRGNLAAVFVISVLVNIGMWFERFVIIVTSLHRDFLPSSWAKYCPTSIEIATLIGSFGLFFTCFLLFCRLLPVICISEVKAVLHYGRPQGDHA